MFEDTNGVVIQGFDVLRKEFEASYFRRICIIDIVDRRNARHNIDEEKWSIEEHWWLVFMKNIVDRQILRKHCDEVY